MVSGIKFFLIFEFLKTIINQLSVQLKQIQGILKSKGSSEAIAFFQTMVPGKQKIYGVKTPVLNEIAKQYRDGSFLLAQELWKSGALEEKIIAIKIMEKKGKDDPEKLFQLFKKFSKTIDNWAVCDGLGMQFLRTVVKTEAARIFSLSEEFSKSKDPWKRRLSLVMVEWYTRDKSKHPQIRKLVKSLEIDAEYYVQKAVSWINRNLEKGK